MSKSGAGTIDGSGFTKAEAGSGPSGQTVIDSPDLPLSHGVGDSPPKHWKEAVCPLYPVHTASFCPS
jgi:hypothetical protein